MQHLSYLIALVVLSCFACNKKDNPQPSTSYSSGSVFEPYLYTLPHQNNPTSQNNTPPRDLNLLVNQPFSTWTIGTDSFRTDSVYVSHTKAGTYMKVSMPACKFEYGTILGRFHSSGAYHFDVGNKTPDPNLLDISFRKADSGYCFPDDTAAYMVISNNGHDIVMELPLSQFRNYFDSTDIQWIKATIRLRE